jgi:alanine dehydrogenase
MSDALLYLSRRDVQALAITPGEARAAVLGALRDHAAGLNQSLPKAALTIGPGHGFQAMPAASAGQGIATLKWVAMAPAPPGSTAQGINGLILVNDLASGVPVAVLDGDEITLIRTAAMSAAAAVCMAPPAPKVIGLIGCGLQAYAHLAAFRDLYPSLTTVLAYSRSRASAERLAATTRGLSAEVVDDANALLTRSDIVGARRARPAPVSRRQPDAAGRLRRGRGRRPQLAAGAPACLRPAGDGQPGAIDGAL